MTQWLSAVFTHPDLAGGAAIAGKTTIIYFFLVAGLRLMGKRELGQMNIYDLVLIIVLANAVQNSMVGSDSSLVGGIIAALTLLFWNRLLTLAMSRSSQLEHVMVGEPTLLVNDGEMIESHMRKEGVTPEQILAALREHGIKSVADARMCILEVDGTISVVPSQAVVQRSHHHYRGLRLP